LAVQVKVTSVLQRVVGAKQVESDGNTVGELLEDLNSKFPGFREQIKTADGSLHKFVNIYINDEDIRYLQSLDTPVKDGDVLQILPALAGGSDIGVAARSIAPAAAKADPASSAFGAPGSHVFARPLAPGRRCGW